MNFMYAQPLVLLTINRHGRRTPPADYGQRARLAQKSFTYLETDKSQGWEAFLIDGSKSLDCPG